VNPLEQVAVFGLVCWLATMIVVESELTAPVRRRIDRWARRTRRAAVVDRLADVAIVGGPVGVFGGIPVVGRTRLLQLAFDLAVDAEPRTWRDRVAYLVHCHLCAGVWIGLLLGLVAGGPVDVRFVGWILSGLAYKGAGHLLLAVQHALEAHR
jgi:hypothetical protein